MGLWRTKMDENSEYASGRVASEHSLSPQHSVLSTIFVGEVMKIYPQMTQIDTDFSFLCVLCVSAVHYFRRSSPWACGAPRWMKTASMRVSIYSALSPQSL